jgi:superfamily I DNA and/or RNA helicase
VSKTRFSTSSIQRFSPRFPPSKSAKVQYLNTREIRFDVVIFDEASQVRPYDAISSIYRGRQLVVAGDKEQLPPTTFFERTTSDDEQEESLSDFESILDVCCKLNLLAAVFAGITGVVVKS